jgi:phosphoribosylformylglycinamidine cyclo-ligase
VTDKGQYARAGVDIDAGNRATQLMAEAIRSTYGPEVLSETGSFGGLYDAAALKKMSRPLLVASTDGVGTKIKVAARLNKWDTVGQDVVNHCINDILVQGASPLFFLDYVASSRLDPEQVATIVGGMAEACRQAGCALIGGETAEMPGVYEPGEVDVVGTIVGVVERDRLISGEEIEPGDAIIGLPSTGLHTNGFSLARMVLVDLDWTVPQSSLGASIGAVLLAVHRSYLEPVRRLLAAGVTLRGMAHITGGGMIENMPRILPPGVDALIRRGTWPEPPIFALIQNLGAVANDEMFRVFNMGLGMLVVVPNAQVQIVLDTLKGDCYHVGETLPGGRTVHVKPE